MDRDGGSVMDFCEYVNQTSDTMKAAIPLTGWMAVKKDTVHTVRFVNCTRLHKAVTNSSYKPIRL